MDPVTTTIVTALVAGTVAASKDVATQAIKDAYGGLKALVVRKLGKKAEVKAAVEAVEKKPDSEGRKTVLAEELQAAEAGEDAEVVARAKELLALLEGAGEKPAVSYRADVRGSGAIAQGKGAVATGEGGVAAGRDIGGDVHTGERSKDP